MGEVDRRTFFRKAGAGAAGVAAAGFVLTKVSDSVGLAEARDISREMGAEPTPPLTAPFTEVYTNVCVELWGRRAAPGHSLALAGLMGPGEGVLLDKDGKAWLSPDGVLHRWIVRCRVEAHGRDDQGRQHSPQVELFPEANVKVENDTGKHMLIQGARGHVLALPGMEFDCDLGSGPFLDRAFGESYRAASPGDNDGFWLTNGNTLTLDWADGGRPMVSIG